MRTAVLLAGGRGERLNPLTLTLPKALIPAPDVPMIRKILEQISTFGFEHVLVLTGYKSEHISKYLASIQFTIRISLFSSDETDSPADRILKAQKYIPDSYMLLYCDNLVSNADLGRHLNATIVNDPVLTMLCESRKEGNVDLKKSVVKFSLEKRNENFPFVELGYILVRKAKNFHTVLQQTRDIHQAFSLLTHQESVTGNVVAEKVISISNLDRYKKLRSERKTILLDRDGVLNRKMPKADYVKSMNDYSPVHTVWRNLAGISEFRLVDFLVVTNQPGIARGMVETKFVEQLHSQMSVEALLKGFNLLAFYVCPHGWDEGCECRKPAPGLINYAITDFGVNLDETYLIGDDERDFQAACRAGIRGKIINDESDFPRVLREILNDLGIAS